MSQIQIAVGILSQRVATRVPEASKERMFTPVLVLESLTTGDEPRVGGQVVCVDRTYVRSKLPD